MFGVVKMFGCVLVLRGIAAANVTAFQAQAQMDPVVAHFEAFFATVGGVWSDLADLIEMRADFHGFVLQPHVKYRSRLTVLDALR